MANQEKRKDERYGLELPIWIKWEDESGQTRQTTGTTKNVSPSGALVVCDSPIGEGCAVVLHFDLPIDLAGAIKSRISAKATVVRRGATGLRSEGAHGHGITFDHFSFTRL